MEHENDKEQADEEEDIELFEVNLLEDSPEQT